MHFQHHREKFVAVLFLLTLFTDRATMRARIIMSAIVAEKASQVTIVPRDKREIGL